MIYGISFNRDKANRGHNHKIYVSHNIIFEVSWHEFKNEPARMYYFTI